MRCSSSGKMCKSCAHRKKQGGCSKEHWLDVIPIALGEKPTKSLYKPSLRTRILK